MTIKNISSEQAMDIVNCLYNHLPRDGVIGTNHIINLILGVEDIQYLKQSVNQDDVTVEPALDTKRAKLHKTLDILYPETAELQKAIANLISSWIIR